MKLTVTTIPVRVPVKNDATPLIQNLGPDPVYFGSQNVAATNGIQLPANAMYEFARDLGTGHGPLFVVSTGTSDLRYTWVG